MSKILKLFTALILMLFCFQHPPAFAIDGDQENYLSEKQGLPDCAPILQQNDLIHPPNYGLIQIQFVYIENQSPKTVYMRKEYIPYRQVQKRNYKHIQKQRLSAKNVNNNIKRNKQFICLLRFYFVYLHYESTIFLSNYLLYYICHVILFFG